MRLIQDNVFASNIQNIDEQIAQKAIVHNRLLKEINELKLLKAALLSSKEHTSEADTKKK